MISNQTTFAKEIPIIQPHLRNRRRHPETVEPHAQLGRAGLGYRHDPLLADGGRGGQWAPLTIGVRYFEGEGLHTLAAADLFLQHHAPEGDLAGQCDSRCDPRVGIAARRGFPVGLRFWATPCEVLGGPRKAVRLTDAGEPSGPVTARGCVVAVGDL
jgi:hypothetical protein